MDGTGLTTPQTYQQKHNIVVVVQHGDVSTQPVAGDAGGQLTLTPGLPVQYQQPQLQQYQANPQQGFVGQLVPNAQQQQQQQQQHQQQQQQYTTPTGVLLPMQHHPQQHAAYQGQFLAMHQPNAAAAAQQPTPSVLQQQGSSQSLAQPAGMTPGQQGGQHPLPMRQDSANGATMMRQSGTGANVVRADVTLPAGGSVLSELDQLAAAVQVTPQQQQQQQQRPQQQQQQQQLPFQTSAQAQQPFQQQQAQQGFAHAQQSRHSWEQPADVAPLQLHQQHDPTSQMAPAAASQTVQLQQQQSQQQQQQLPQAAALDTMLVVQQPPQQTPRGLLHQHQAQQAGQPVVHVQQQQQQQQMLGLHVPQAMQQQHVLVHAVNVSAGHAAFATPAVSQLHIPGQGQYDAVSTPPLDGQGWCGMPDIAQQQQQLPVQVPQLQVPQPTALTQPAQGQVQPPMQHQQPTDQHMLANLGQLTPGQLMHPQQQQTVPPSPQCWGGPLAVVAQTPTDASGQPGSPLAFLAGSQHVAAQPQQVPQQVQQQQQHQQQVQQALDLLGTLQPLAMQWDGQQPQLQQLQLTPQQQQQDQFVDAMLMQQQQSQQHPQQVVSSGMVAAPHMMGVRGTPAQLAPSPVPMQVPAMPPQQQLHLQQQQPQAAGLMLPPVPRAPAAPQQPPQQQQQQQQQQQLNAALPPWRQGDVLQGSGITAAAIDKEIPWAELQFGQQIGEGGFGKVYYGTWRGQAVAIKVLNPQSADSAKLMSEFNREVSTMTRLPEHPNVLKLLGVCTTPPNLALVTQFCAKGSLYGMLHSPGCYLSWVQVVEMLLDAAQGMEHLHTNSVLHRDLKSGNLLVDQDNVVRVADFGLSRLYHGMHTMTGGLGTFQWMAPEVLANQRYSNKADIYSFGMVMWECCARQVPFEGLNGVQAALAVMSRGMRPEIPQHTPAGLAALMQDCWAPIPEQRPGFDVVVVRLQDLLQQLKHAEVTATAAAAANRTAAAITAAATGAPMNNSGS